MMRRLMILMVLSLVGMTTVLAQGLITKMESATTTLEMMGALRAPASKPNLLKAEQGKYPIDVVFSHGIELAKKEGADGLRNIEGCVKFLTESGLDLNSGKKSAYVRAIEYASAHEELSESILDVLHRYGGNPVAPTAKKSFLYQVVTGKSKVTMSDSFLKTYLKSVASDLSIDFDGEASGTGKTWRELAAGNESVLAAM